MGLTVELSSVFMTCFGKFRVLQRFGGGQKHVQSFRLIYNEVNKRVLQAKIQKN